MTQAPSRTPTAKELTAARRAQAPTAPTPTSQVPATQAQARAVVPTTPEDYQQEYLDEVAPSGIAGRLIKFDKDGEFITVDDGKPVPEDAEFIALLDDTQIGWIRFNGPGEAPDRCMGLFFDGFILPDRATLGDTDETQWDTGLDNLPSDPWKHQQNIVLQHVETRELFTFSTASKTGRRAVGTLLRHYKRMKKSSPNELPVVRLGRGSFPHKDPRVGLVNVPVFIVVARCPRDSAAKPDTSLGTFLQDEIKF